MFSGSKQLDYVVTETDSSLFAYNTERVDQEQQKTEQDAAEKVADENAKKELDGIINDFSTKVDYKDYPKKAEDLAKETDKTIYPRYQDYLKTSFDKIFKPEESLNKYLVKGTNLTPVYKEFIAKHIKEYLTIKKVANDKDTKDLLDKFNTITDFKSENIIIEAGKISIK
jgi:hypothetical protein